MPVEPGQKYGMVVLPSVVLGEDIPDRLDLCEGLWTSTQLPVGLPDHWEEWIGSLRSRTLAEGDLFLVAGGPAEQPDVLDPENEAYVRQAYDLLLGLHVSGVLVTHGSPHRLTGANRDGEVDVRSIGELPASHFVRGTPLRRVNRQDIEEASVIAEALAGIREAEGFDRLGRAFRAFYDGIHDDRVDERIHQFLRCVEGFVIPEQGRTLSRLRSRSELFIGAGHHHRVGEWFDIRSAVEHLHGSHESVPGDELRDRLIRVMRRSWEVESVARHCLRRVLLNRELRGRFESDAGLEDFWDLDREERRQEWGGPIDLEAVAESFDEQAIGDDQLGL